MTPWELLAWAVALGVSLIVLAVATVVVIAAVKAGSNVNISHKRRSVKR